MATIKKISTNCSQILQKVLRMRLVQGRITHHANHAMAWGPPSKGAPLEAEKINFPTPICLVLVLEIHDRILELIDCIAQLHLPAIQAVSRVPVTRPMSLCYVPHQSSRRIKFLQVARTSLPGQSRSQSDVRMGHGTPA
jgi:hypothetical protein